MLTATKDLILPTTVTGSWPRPRWYVNNTHGERFASALVDAEFREQFLDATAAVLSEQELAGLDILTNGDYHLDPEVAGRSWLHYPIDHLAGVSSDDRWSSVPEATYLHEHAPLVAEIFRRWWMWPRVTGRLSWRHPLDLARIWEEAQRRTAKPIKMGIISAQTLSDFLEPDGSVYRDRKGLIWDLAKLINGELRRLVEAGCSVVQIEEPALHAAAATGAADEELEFLVDALNFELQGLERAEVWVHTCWGSPCMQTVYRNPDYRASAELFAHRVNADVWTVEVGRGLESFLDTIRQLDAGSVRPKIALGVVSHRTLTVEPPDEIAGVIRRALEIIPPDRLVLSSDCGFGREGCPRLVATFKAAAMVEASNIVRQELGAPTAPVPVMRALVGSMAGDGRER